MLRDDLLTYGSKTRKLLPLIQHWLAESCTAVVLVGGALSNNVLAAAGLCVQQGLRPIALLRGEPPIAPLGNYAALQSIVPAADMHWLARNQWATRDAAAHALAQLYADDLVAVCPEGTVLPQAVEGLQGMLHEIRTHEYSTGVQFAQVWVDAGTGFTAAVLCWASHLLAEVRQYHIVQMAGDATSFREMLAQVGQWLGQRGAAWPSNYLLHQPVLAPRYGHIIPEVLVAQQQYLQEEGLLLDPIYGVKLFATYVAHRTQQPDRRPILILHSGRPLT